MTKEHSELCASLPAYLKASIKPEVKSINVEKREVLHRITSINPDRVGDVVVPKGADLDSFRRHPVVLEDHSYTIRSILGRAVHLDVRKDGIDARTKYFDTPLGNDAFNIVREGLGAFSIGFKPTDIEPIEDESRKGITGFLIKEWELLEYSQVAIPMNPDAVTLAVQKGLIHPENVARLFCAPAPAPVKEVAKDSGVLAAFVQQIKLTNDTAELAKKVKQ